MDVSDETQSPGHFTAREEAVNFIELGAGWAGCFGEELVVLFLPGFEPQTFQQIS
jgi:hypothetical protein